MRGNSGIYYRATQLANFDVGGYELGLNPDVSSGTGAGGTIAYWGVDDIDKAVAHFTGLGAPVVEAAHDVGEGIKVATVADPFGNLIGLIVNPQFKVR